MDVAKLSALGMESKEIAYKIGLKNHTVRSYLKSVRLKLSAKNAVQVSNRLRESNVVVLKIPRIDIKLKARQALNNALRNGLAVRGPCEECGSPKTEAHHEDYSKPLRVKWFCKKHHEELHRNRR